MFWVLLFQMPPFVELPMLDLPQHASLRQQVDKRETRKKADNSHKCHFSFRHLVNHNSNHPFWEPSPAPSMRPGVSLLSLCPSLAPALLGCRCRNLLFPTRCLFLWGPASSSWVGPDHLLSSKGCPMAEECKRGHLVVTGMDLDSVIQSEVSQKDKNKYHILTHIYGI